MMTYLLFFSCHAVMTFAFRAAAPRAALDSTIPGDAGTPVAICCTIADDLVEATIESCFRLDHPNVSVFLCDDSFDPTTRARVDALAANRDCCFVVRRTDRASFKAGNLNNLLRIIGDGYRYLLLVDNDSIIAPDFIRTALLCFERDPSLAFVQACHRASEPPDATPFQRSMALSVAAAWRCASVKNRFGIPLMLGHGALLSLERLREAGGFPDRVAEDLALTVRLRELGHRGAVVEIWCEEGVPPTFTQYRRQFEKWIIGLCEFLRRDFRSLASSRIPASERFDIVLGALTLLNGVMLLAFIAVTNVVWPLAAGDRHTILLGGGALRMPVLQLSLFQQWHPAAGVRIAIVTATIASLVFFLPDLRHSPWRTLRHISNGFVCVCGMLVPAFVAVVLCCTTGRYAFRVTGRAEGGRWRRGLAANLHVGRGLSLIIEIAAGAGGIAMALLTWNMFLASIASGILLAPFLDVLGWNRTLLIGLRHLPFLLLCIQLFFLAMPSGFIPGGMFIMM